MILPCKMFIVDENVIRCSFTLTQFITLTVLKKFIFQTPVYLHVLNLKEIATNMMF